MISSEEIARILLQIKAVHFNVLKGVSKTNASFSFDGRLINSSVAVRKTVVNAFVEKIKEHFSGVEVIAGIVPGGLPYGVLIADRLNLPFIYVRSKAKEHGLKKQVEGFYMPRNKVVVIEDFISTGASSMLAIEALKSEGLLILGLLSIVNEDSKLLTRNSSEHNINLESLCDHATILKVAADC